MATTLVSAGQVMDRVANLLNDPNKTDYTYRVIVPYLNTAIDELSESMAEFDISPSQAITAVVLPIGEHAIWQNEVVGTGPARYPTDLIEVKEVRERSLGAGGAGSTQNKNAYTLMTRVETQPFFPATNRLMVWYWEDQAIKFNPLGATEDLDIQIHYLRQGIPYVADENSPIYMIHARSFLAFKTAALCAMFIGENESRAEILEDQAGKAMERLTTISNKGRQQISTRHRPFRAGYKSRGGY